MNVIFSLANNDVHTKDDVVSDSPQDEVVSRRTLINKNKEQEEQRLLKDPCDIFTDFPMRTLLIKQNFYGCAYPDETISDLVCITRSSEARVKTNDRSWYHRGHGQSVFCTSRLLKNTTV